MLCFVQVVAVVVDSGVAEVTEVEEVEVGLVVVEVLTEVVVALNPVGVVIADVVIAEEAVGEEE